ncbi:hypothetical protein Tco_0150498 [Tanacetum coccineum]
MVSGFAFARSLTADHYYIRRIVDADTMYSSKSGNGLLVHQVLDMAYVQNRFSLVVLSALRRSDKENMQVGPHGFGGSSKDGVGEVSLPRGKADKDDIDDVDTMTREAKEMSRRKLIIQITRFHVPFCCLVEFIFTST